MSRSLAANAGSLDSLKVRARCGRGLWARQIRCTELMLIPTAAAMALAVQWAASCGGSVGVSSTTRSIVACARGGMRDGRGLSRRRPATPPRKLAAVAVEDRARDLVAALAAVELGQDAPTVALVVDEAEQVERLHQPPELPERTRELRRPVVRLERAGEPAGAHDAELQRAGEAQQVVPVLGD